MQSQIEVILDPPLNFSSAAKDYTASNLSDSKMATLGYSGKFPDANINEKFWTFLQNGQDIAGITPSRRWDVRTHVDPTLKRKNTMGAPYGCWLQEPGLFDAPFFMVSPREAPQMGPYCKTVARSPRRYVGFRH